LIVPGQILCGARSLSGWLSCDPFVKSQHFTRRSLPAFSSRASVKH
jgi:hypothetical protein